MKTIKRTQITSRSLIFILLLVGGLQSNAQKRTCQSWSSVSAKFALSKKTNFHISELASFTPAEQFKANFYQTSVALSYDINKKITIKAGDQLNYIVNSSRPVRNRVFVSASLDNNFLHYLRTEHAIQVELHDKNESRYSQRIILRNSISLRKRFSPLKLKPSISYWLYYNMGGSTIQYYDKSGLATVAQTPDGFHRSRLYFSLSSRFSKAVNLSAYYMVQKEFNLFTSEYRNINVVNPSTGRISRPYDDGNTIGLSLAFSFDRRSGK